VAFNRFAIALN